MLTNAQEALCFVQCIQHTHHEFNTNCLNKIVKLHMNIMIISETGKTFFLQKDWLGCVQKVETILLLKSERCQTMISHNVTFAFQNNNLASMKASFIFLISSVRTNTLKYYNTIDYSYFYFKYFYKQFTLYIFLRSSL